MNKKTYDLSMLCGVVLVATGVGATWGIAAALMGTGALVIGLTLFAATFLKGSD